MATTDGPVVISFGSAELYGIDSGEKANVVHLPTGGLDGIVAYPGGFYVSSWDGSSILSGTRDGAFEVVLSDVPAPADIEFDAHRNRLLIPLFQNNEVQIVPMGR